MTTIPGAIPPRSPRLHPRGHVRRRLSFSLWSLVLLLFPLLCPTTHAHDSGYLLIDPDSHPRMQARHDTSATPEPVPTTTTNSADHASSTSDMVFATDTSLTTPKPFDSNVGNNFTSTTCATFFDTILSNQTFNDCLPLSLLLQTSNTFFTTSRSPLLLTQTLHATCTAPHARCTALMTFYAAEIQRPTTCGPDLATGNPTATQARQGFRAYDVLYRAGCLTDPAGAYCYASAVADRRAPSSPYVYFLPLGVPLPGGAAPACSPCLQRTMAVFAQAAGEGAVPRPADYRDAARQIQMNCGPGFVDAGVPTSDAAVVGGGSRACWVGWLSLVLWLVSGRV